MIYFYFDEVKDIKTNPEYYLPDEANNVWVFNPYSNKLELCEMIQNKNFEKVQAIKTIKCFSDENIFNKFFSSILKKLNKVTSVNENNILLLSFCKEYNDLIEFGFMIIVTDKSIIPRMEYASMIPTLSWNQKNKFFNLIQ